MQHADLKEIKEITKTALKNQDLLQQLNGRAASQREIRQVIGDITGQQIDDSVEIRLPIRSDYGANLRIGKGDISNSGVMFTDLGCF